MTVTELLIKLVAVSLGAILGGLASDVHGLGAADTQNKVLPICIGKLRLEVSRGALWHGDRYWPGAKEPEGGCYRRDGRTYLEYVYPSLVLWNEASPGLKDNFRRRYGMQGGGYTLVFQADISKFEDKFGQEKTFSSMSRAGLEHDLEIYDFRPGGPGSVPLLRMYYSTDSRNPIYIVCPTRRESSNKPRFPPNCDVWRYFDNSAPELGVLVEYTIPDVDVPEWKRINEGMTQLLNRLRAK